MLDSDELNKSGFNVNIWMISLFVRAFEKNKLYGYTITCV